MNWYYAEHGQQVGPVTDEQLAQLFQAGKVNDTTLVWREGLSDWMPHRQAMALSNPASASQPPVSGALNPQGESEVVCAECGRMFPASETVRFGKASVCAGCKPVFLQKLSEGARVNTGELNYAGFWIRFAAKFLDGLVLGIPFMIVFFAVLFPGIKAGNGRPPQLGYVQLIQVAFMALNLAYQIFFLGKYGATLGKMACKLKVVTSEGEKISYGRATGRVFAEILSGLICYIGYIMVAFDGEKRALHDHICNTRVVNK